MVTAVPAATVLPQGVVAGPVAVAAPPLPLPVIVDGQVRVATAAGGRPAVFFQTGLPVSTAFTGADGGVV